VLATVAVQRATRIARLRQPADADGAVRWLTAVSGRRTCAYARRTAR
jgi:hypothetical protein